MTYSIRNECILHKHIHALYRHCFAVPSRCQHNNSEELDCQLSSKVIVSVAFDSKINKTICRQLATVNDSIGCVHCALCIASYGIAFRFYDPIKMESNWNDSKRFEGCIRLHNTSWYGKFRETHSTVAWPLMADGR